MTLRTFASEGPLEVVDVLVERELLLFAELVVADVADELAVDEGGGGVVHPPGDRHDLKRRLALARHVLYSHRSLNDKNKCRERFTRWLLSASGYNTSKCEVDILASPNPSQCKNFTQIQRESILVGCVPPACQPYVFRWPPLNISMGWGIGYRSHVGGGI